MLVSTVYDTSNPTLNMNYASFLLALDQEIQFELPNGDWTTGILHEVIAPEEGPLLELIINIDNRYEDMFHPVPNFFDDSILDTHNMN